MGRNRALLRIFLTLFLVLVLVLGCFGAFLYYSTSQLMIQQLGSKCVGIASAVAVIVEEDLSGYRDFAATLDTGSDYYRSTLAKLQQIRQANADSIAFLYTEIRISQDEMMYLFDAEPADSELHSPPGETAPLNEGELQAYETATAAFSGDFFTDLYGSLLTCYAPILDRESGELVGLVGVDISKEQYSAVMRNQLLSIVGSVALLMVMLAATLALSSDRLVRLILLDSLTGTYNKSTFMKDLRRQIRISRKKSLPLTVFMADLDHFKEVNDRYGHPFGDRVLEAVARAISTTLRKTDCLARYGGEEFAVYLPGMGAAAGVQVAERIRRAVEETVIYNEETGEPVSVTVSIGVAQVAPGQSSVDVIREADRALYHAKQLRNTVSAERNAVSARRQPEGSGMI